jgi:hypothetical protein
MSSLALASTSGGGEFPKAESISSAGSPGIKAVKVKVMRLIPKSEKKNFPNQLKEFFSIFIFRE